MKKILIVIPTRYASKRLPGKPLVKIAGVEMVKRVAEIAAFVCKNNPNCAYVVATDDVRIEEFCKNSGINVRMTSPDCQNGTERCWDTVRQEIEKPDLVVNLQGDNPLCPPWIIQDIIDEYGKYEADLYTPCVQLDWKEYDALKAVKEKSPYSGTTVLVDKHNYALAFSKTIIPAIRKEADAKAKFGELSPVRRHIGLYAYTYKTLEDYFTMDHSAYEESCVEGLEQMRFLHNGLRIKIAHVDYRGRETTSGVDSPGDIEIVEAIIAKYGEIV
jgi:3-deoxy-manno-octulosonate cytidylyltransferase (CMP-KDO synthetase)